MQNWMTVKDLSHYLQISENKIRFFIKHKQIPCHNNHGFLRFKREEIDAWMSTPAREDIGVAAKKSRYIYRGKPVKSYALTASKILVGKKPWKRLPEFINNFVERVNEIKIHDNGRNFLYRKEFAIFSNNFNDYLKVGFHLGLIEKKKGAGIEKQYYPTIYAERISAKEDIEQIRNIILDSILYIVRGKMENLPDERHSILLLWYFLTLKEKGMEPAESHFRKSGGELNYSPVIRLNFSKSLCGFLFDNDREKEKQFLHEWKKLL